MAGRGALRLARRTAGFCWTDRATGEEGGGLVAEQPETFAKLLRKLRTDVGLAQEDLAPCGRSSEVKASNWAGGPPYTQEQARGATDSD
jgi:hypothetical protein